MKRLLTAISILIFCQSAGAQLYTDSLSLWRKSQELNKSRLYTVAGGEILLAGGSYLALGELWYGQYPKDKFHFFDDNNNWLNMDKVGHSMSVYYLSYVSKSLYEWAGVRKQNATWIGGGSAFLYLTGVEILDGFAADWGFSWGDMIANASGASLMVAQELLWREQRMVLKWSWHPTEYAAVSPDLLGRGWHESFLKDYNGQTYWLSMNVNNLSGWDKWPEWLNFAVGYGADGMISASYEPVIYNESDRYKWQRQYYLSMDIDLRKLPVKSQFWKGVLNAINFIKIPMPAVEFNEKGGVNFYPLYF